MVGVTLYVSITTEESVKIDQGYPVMGCSYGFSFLCAVFSFVLQELTGVLTVYWFIYRFRALVRKQEKLRERTRQLMGNCLSMTTALPLNFAAFAPANHHPAKSPSNQNNTDYQHTSNDTTYPFVHKKQHQRNRMPFDKSISPPLLQHNEETRTPTLAYGDYCRVLIRTEDMELLTRMVRSKSQAQLAASSRPTTPATLIVAKSSTGSRTSRRNAKKPFKRTTSV